MQGYETGKSKYSLQNKANLRKQKYMTQKLLPKISRINLKSSPENKKIQELKRKPIHGQFYRDLERPSIDKEKSLGLCSSDLKGEKERVY
jgi:hypothetical protein